LNTSILIITYNGAGKIPRLLLSLNDIPQNAWEVIIVDDGSIDNTAEIIHSLELKYPWKLIRQENKGRAVAKNRAAAEARYELLWFLDDDMRVIPETLSAHLSHHLKHPGTISVGSTIEDDEFVKTDIQRYRLYITNKWKDAIEKVANPLGVEELFIASANFSISKNLFDRLNGFDARLRDAEDLDLAYRSYLASIPIYYNKEAVGYHRDLITCYSYIIRNRQYTLGYQILRKLNPEYYQINKRMHFSAPIGGKRAFLSFICQPVYVWLIDNFNIFIIIPRSLRYRFYEMLIFGLGRLFTTRKLIR
jgi:glycosyltransferase involved in cell wall biosynthesis